MVIKDGHYKQGKCKFDKDGSCEAMACYADRKCGARDPFGNPIYKVIESNLTEKGVMIKTEKGILALKDLLE